MEILGLASRPVLDSSGTTRRTPWKMEACAPHRVVRIDEVGDIVSGLARPCVFHLGAYVCGVVNPPTGREAAQTATRVRPRIVRSA